jgi:predicted nucleotidyltransferase
MIQNYSRYGVLEAFFDNPTKIFMVRELCRYAKITQPSATLHLKALVKEGLLLKSDEGLYGGYVANRDSDEFKLLKRQNLIYRISKSGLLNFLSKKIQPESLIIFGSASRGEDIESSDIDIFVESPSEDLDLKKYEKLLKRKIHLLFNSDFKKMKSEIKNNIVNGTKLYGYLRGY